MRTCLIKTARHNRSILFLLCIAIAAIFLLPVAAHADESGKAVRVGWHEEPYFITDKNGRLSGYTYDYQQKLVAYTGWTYDYVEGSWSELMQMLKDGEIDLMGNVSYTEEREKEIDKEELQPLDPEGKKLAEHKRFTFDGVDIPSDPLR